MKELSLNILDIAKNSVKANATLVQILLNETQDLLTLTIADDGCGMTEEILRGVSDPFYTTRTTRKVGMGIPLLKLAAEQTGGNVEITSRHELEYPNDHGTVVVAKFFQNHIDFTPMGDVVTSIVTLIQGNPKTDFLFRHQTDSLCVELDTRQVRDILGEDVPLDSYEVLQWIEGYLQEQYQG